MQKKALDYAYTKTQQQIRVVENYFYNFKITIEIAIFCGYSMIG